MKSKSSAEELVIQEIMQTSEKMKSIIRGLSIGTLIKYIRIQLGISQKILSKRAGVRQATISRMEQNQNNISLLTLRKILNALSCDLLIAPLLRDSIDNIRLGQARKVAEKQIRYLKGTMNLEEQQPDTRFIEKLLKQEEENLLQGSNTKLWED